MSKAKREIGTSCISDTILKFWNDHKLWGDYQKISDKTGFSRPTITDAFNGIATSDVCTAITNFYLERVNVQDHKTK